MQQQQNGYSAVYSQSTSPCPSCGGGGAPWPAAAQMAAAIPPQPVPTTAQVLPAAPATQPSAAMQAPYQQINFQQVPGAVTPSAIVPSSYAPGSTGFVPNTPPESFPITDLTQPMPMTTESLQYLNGFLRTQIGRRVRVEFLLGTNTLTDRTGTLLGVGANYILINESDSDDLLACDFYNIKFIRFYY